MLMMMLMIMGAKWRVGLYMLLLLFVVLLNPPLPPPPLSLSLFNPRSRPLYSSAVHPSHPACILHIHEHYIR